MPTESDLGLHKRFFNVWLDFEEASKLEKLASNKGVGVCDVLREMVSPVLAGKENENEARNNRVAIHVPKRTYYKFIKFFEGDEEMAVVSMLGHLEVGADDFAQTMKKAEQGR